MIRLSDISISAKLMFISSLGIVLVGGMIGMQVYGNRLINEANADATRQLENATRFASIESAIRNTQLSNRSLRLVPDLNALENERQTVNARFKVVAAKIEDATASVYEADQRERLAQLKALAEQYIAGSQDIVRIRAEHIRSTADKSEAGAAKTAALWTEVNRVSRDKTQKAGADISALSEKAAAVSQDYARRSIDRAETMASSIEWMNLGLTIATMAVLIGAAIFGRTSIARPLKRLIVPIGEVAKGHFNVKVEGTGRGDEIGQIASAVSAMVTQMSATITEIKRAASEVNGASSEIAGATTDLSQRTEEQAASLEETSAAMEQISSAVKNSSFNAERANGSAAEACAVAGEGGAIVTRAIGAMAKIEESSRKISDIIGVIDEIARQTNLLALNAAVEAARAGEAGRGFAVVASEVRSLAQRSSQAAKDIKTLITNSGAQVDEGVQLVNHTGEALNKIVGSVREVATLVDEIARASAEQSSGLDQINTALTQMDEVTQKNAALVEENAATAKSLEMQARTMDDHVSYFKLGAAPAPPLASAASPAPAQARFAHSVRALPGGRRTTAPRKRAANDWQDF